MMVRWDPIFSSQGKMPLPKANGRNEYTNLMFTFGPRPEVLTRQKVEEVLRLHLGARMVKGMVAFEHSKKGYPHVHVAVKFAKAQKVPMALVKAFKALSVEAIDATGKLRKVNCGTNNVPRNECGKGGYEVLEKYLSDPSKIKECDDESLELVQEMNMVDKLKRLLDFHRATVYYRKFGHMPTGWYKRPCAITGYQWRYAGWTE